MCDMSSNDSDVLLLPSDGDKNLLDEKLRSLIRTSEINLTRIPPSSPSGHAISPSSPLSNNKHTITISITSSSTSHESAGSVSVNRNAAGKQAEAVGNGPVACPDKKKRKKHHDMPPVVSRQVIYATPEKKERRGPLFRHRLDQDSPNESSEDDCCSSEDSSLPLPAVSLFAPDLDLDLSELRMNLVLQKWVLSKWINLKRKQLQGPAAQVRRQVADERRTATRSVLSSLIEDASERGASSIRKGVCCFCSDDAVCPKPSLPYTRHCKEHILYNVDQLLFTRCTAKHASSLTQCLRPTFDIEHDEPICELHARSVLEMDWDGSSGGKAVRKRTKQMALTRPARKKKRKGKDSDALTDFYGGVDETDKMPPPPPYSSCPAALAETDLPAPLDMDIPNLGPGDEALVASLVEDLDPLPLVPDPSSSAFDAELTDVLNKMPVDAFHELFTDHPIKQSVPEADSSIGQSFSSKACQLPNGEPAYPFVSPASGHVNGHAAPSAVHPNPRPLLHSTPLPNEELVNDILGFLTTEQQQQLNGLIDGALESGALTLKHATPCLELPFPETSDLSSLAPTHVFKSNIATSRTPAVETSSSPHPQVPPFAQFDSRVRSTGPHANATSFSTSSTGSLIITGLNEAPLVRNQFMRLSDMRLSNSASVRGHATPRPTCPLPPLAAAFDKKTS